MMWILPSNRRQRAAAGNRMFRRHTTSSELTRHLVAGGLSTSFIAKTVGATVEVVEGWRIGMDDGVTPERYAKLLYLKMALNLFIDKFGDEGPMRLDLLESSVSPTTVVEMIKAGDLDRALNFLGEIDRGYGSPSRTQAPT